MAGGAKVSDAFGQHAHGQGGAVLEDHGDRGTGLIHDEADVARGIDKASAIGGVDCVRTAHVRGVGVCIGNVTGQGCDCQHESEVADERLEGLGFHELHR